MRNLIIVGAGGHGKVTADAAYEMGIWGSIVFLDDRYPINPVCGFPVVGKNNYAKDIADKYLDLIVAIGNNVLRIDLIGQYLDQGFHLATIIHPRAYVSKFAKLERGTVVFANSVVNAGSEISEGCIINTGATIDHDCILGKGVHISPGVHLAGGVTVGKFTSIGIGASVIQQVKIGESVILGAGSVAINNIDSGATVVGVPGRIIKQITNLGGGKPE
jgi:sugar O-acyltransferase (sialic acid O-acetyltransferase NeuD family)